MQCERYVIGVDIGTTSTKVVLFDVRGNILNTQNNGYNLLMPSPGVAEQEPGAIHDAVVRGIAAAMAQSGVDPRRLAGIAFSSAMHSLIAVDADGRPLTRSITWADNRSARWARKVMEEMDGLAIYRRTGTPIHAMSPFVKLLWLRDAQPDLMARAARFISIKEYVLHRLFGVYAVDHSIASATGLFNLETLDWDAGALAAAGIDRSRLSEPVPTTHVLTGLSAETAARLGVRPETPVVVGASDGVLSNLGLNAVSPGVVALTIGTSGAIRTVADRPMTDPQGRLFCYALTEKHWVVGGAVNNGGVVLSWARDRLAGRETAAAVAAGGGEFDALEDLLAAAPPGAGGLLFHPYLAGERAPLWDADARGSFFGLTLRHTSADMARAVAEGVVLNLHLVLEMLEAFVGPSRRIHASGGFARSPLLRQMLADVFDREVAIPESVESSCLGAAVLGLHALGEVPALEAVAEMVALDGAVSPAPAAVAAYDRVKPVFAGVLAHLRQAHAAVARLQDELGG